MKKTCPSCLKNKSLDCFSPRSGRAGVRAWCKECENEKTKKQLDKYRKNEPDRIKNYKLKSLYGITIEQWESLKADYGGRCVYCNKVKENLEPDHIVAKSRGGKKGIDNMVPACESCNCSKNGTSLLMWMWRKVNV